MTTRSRLLLLLLTTWIAWSALSGVILPASPPNKRVKLDLQFVLDSASELPLPIRTFNWATRDVGFFKRIFSLRKEDLVARAKSRCFDGDNKTRFWEHPYNMEALEALTSALEERGESPLTTLGRIMLSEQLVMNLCIQTEIERIFDERGAEINASFARRGFDSGANVLIVGGPPRSGTTHLLSLLCSSPFVGCLTVTEALNPVFKGRDVSEVLTMRDARTLFTKFSSGFVNYLRPLFRYMFNYEYDAPFEEVQLGSLVFGSGLYYTMFSIPSYYEWWLRTDHTPMEEYTKKCLALIMYQRGESNRDGKNVKWLVLKSPQNSELYDEKARVFPEAVFAFTHRLPHQFLSSMVGMATYTFLVSNGDSYGGEISERGKPFRDMGHFFLRHYEYVLLNRMKKSRVDRTLWNNEVVHIKFEDYMRDPVNTASRLLRKLAERTDGDAALHLPESEEAFRAYQRTHEREGIGSTRFDYDLVSFVGSEAGSEEALRVRFAEYIREYGL